MSQTCALTKELKVWENILDRYGHPRLDVARNFFLPLQQEDVPLLLEAFEFWQTYDEYGLIEGENQVTGERLYLAIKCSKRGNDVFASRLKRKLGFLRKWSDVKFFSLKDFNTHKTVKTRLLWVTLTYDSKKCSLHDAWLDCMQEYNLFITNLRNKYGKIDVLRFIQPFPSSEGAAFGYPHFHLVLLFQEAEFEVFPRFEADSEGKNSLVFRVKEKYEIEAQGKYHSFIDVKALKSARAVSNYVVKYAENVAYGESSKALINSAVMWLYRKQTYSMSGSFRRSYHDLMVTKQGSKVQLMLDGAPLEEWVWSWRGVRSGASMGAQGVWLLE
ncbi:hypothetical protein GTO27_02965, partial [Candidatus Bathyarchaeota archaeon]|nr:hypothetical protein [Candidatus Bathyarchaeota archaeon]